jgi:hypothetical protein
MSGRIFLLSPASCAGRRAALLLRDEATFDVAQRLHAGGIPLGEAFAFLSGLYFRGKLAYARRFARPPAGLGGAYVITTCHGLLPPESPVTAADLRAFAAVPIDPAEARYRAPLVRTAAALAAAAPATQVVLLGSIAGGKYVEPLRDIFGDRLLFPQEFVGRGDMSRGGLMLRCVADAEELTYVPVMGATRRGARPAKLAPRPGLLAGSSDPDVRPPDAVTERVGRRRDRS